MSFESFESFRGRGSAYPVPESLPVCGLSDAADIYLRSVSPILTEAEYAETKLKTERFVQNEGAALHERLLEYAREISPESWLYDRLSESYLSMRRPITVDGNFILEAVPPVAEGTSYLECVSLVVRALASVFMELKDGSFPAMSIKKRGGLEIPLCMRQYELLFRTAKIPKKNKDELVVFDYEDIDSIGVFHKNILYKLCVVNNGEIESVSRIFNALSAICEGENSENGENGGKHEDGNRDKDDKDGNGGNGGNDGEYEDGNRDKDDKDGNGGNGGNDGEYEDGNRDKDDKDGNGGGVGVSAVSVAGSDRAAYITEGLCRDNPANAQAFCELAKTMFNVSLCETDRASRPPVELLLGRAEDFWAYSPMSIFAYTDNYFCFNFEHTPVDGLTNMTVIRRAFDKIRDICGAESTENAESAVNAENAKSGVGAVNAKIGVGACGFRKIEFDLTSACGEIKRVKQEYLSCAAQYDMLRHKICGVPFAELKKIGVPPDTYLQTAFLYAQMAAYGELRSTHESVSVTQFCNGRTACVKSANVWARELYFVFNETESVSNSIEGSIGGSVGGSVENKALELLKKSAEEQMLKINAAKKFCCFVRLSQGLIKMYEMFGESLGIKKMPEIFEDKSYARYLAQEVSTSTVGNAPYIHSFAFAPQVERGLGVGYVTEGDCVTVSVSFFVSERETVALFVEGLDEFFRKMNPLVCKSAKNYVAVNY